MSQEVPEPVAQVLEAVTAPSPVPGVGTVVIAVVLALAAVLTPRVSRYPRYLITQTHEGAHALVGVLARRSVHSIRLEADLSGSTVTSGRERGIGRVATTFAGYLGPTAVAVGVAVAVNTGHAVAALAAYGIGSVLMLPLMRNLHGALFVATIVAIAAAALWWGSGQFQTITALTLAFYLAFGGVSGAVMQRKAISSPRYGGNADAEVLHALTRIPRTVWVWFYITVCATGAVCVAVSVVSSM